MRIIATLTEAASNRRYLEGVGPSAEPLLIAPARLPAAPKPRLICSVNIEKSLTTFGL